VKKVLFALAVLSISTFFVGCNSSDYKEAEELLSNHEYNEAIIAFSKLSGYKDSDDKIIECKYQLCLNDFDDELYDKALAGLLEIENYKDAKEKITCCSYYLGIEAFNKGMWEEAISYLSDLDYSDSQSFLEKSLREKGMNENADYAFLKDIEKSITNRLNDSQSGVLDYETLVDEELAIVEKYKSETFYDLELKKIATNYIEGLRTQKNSFNEDFLYEQDYKWKLGYVERAKSLKELYEKYSFLSDDTKFIANYINNLEDDENELKALKAIEDDLDSQSIEFEYNNGYLNAVINNSTDYKYSTEFVFRFLDSNSTLLETRYAYAESVKPNSSYQILVFIDDISSAEGYEWESHYYDIKMK